MQSFKTDEKITEETVDTIVKEAGAMNIDNLGKRGSGNEASLRLTVINPFNKSAGCLMKASLFSALFETPVSRSMLNHFAPTDERMQGE